MFWEDRVDWMTKRYGASEFKVPFTYWVDILKKIEAKFIIDDLNYHFSAWSGRIRNKIKLAEIDRKRLEGYLEQLSDSTNYWVVLASSENSKHYVYDCGINPLITLALFSRGNFYIIDKRYSWFVAFDINANTEADVVYVYKSGPGTTPFDGLY